MSTLENTTTAIVHEAINEEYEYIQYNKQLRLIRSVKDDMHQMQSIMNALRSTKQALYFAFLHVIFDLTNESQLFVILYVFIFFINGFMNDSSCCVLCCCHICLYIQNKKKYFIKTSVIFYLV